MREIRIDVLMELNDKYGQKPLCKYCDRNLINRFATGWRIINKSHNLTPDNLEPACKEHQDNLRIESLNTKQSKR